VTRRFDEGCPVLLAAKIDDAPGTAQTVRDPPLIRHRLMRGLGTARRSAPVAGEEGEDAWSVAAT
jgi:hypothetical protein